ncbi:hypothetical protein LVB87_10035 [Lysobacter sp. KIS68-7]|uniref:hypothetical protein n=1 Tax=Lysobacter sp. KIS68-7 TaxID=2904252 RepID=UPI001E600C81|nr:hypothetical protein [Lysobacter sp. KIS68-7]UHQ18548.1 hypothetical protein LVB87_10035 [Lysobacter sp. KIS68-7]
MDLTTGKDMRTTRRVECAVMLALAVTAMPTTASAICIETPLEPQVAAAQAIFIATITKATLDLPADAKEGTWFKVRYNFRVDRRIKGDPTIVTSLITGGAYNDPNSERFVTFAEQSRLVPGDNILVVADKPGEVGVSTLPGCTASRPWNQETYDETRSLPGF